MSEGIVGNQVPRYSVVPYSVFTDGTVCGKLSATYGLKPDQWQQTVLDGWLSCLKDGTYVSSSCGLAVPRQNGKNGVLEMIELFKLTIQGRKILHTAHEVKTCRKAFLRLSGFFEDEEKYPELAEQVKSVRRTNGQEAIYLKNGASIEFIARSKSSGRGFTVDDVVIDEAQELTDEQYEVLSPTTSASPSGNPQTFFTGTPTPPTSPGTVFARIRKRAINGLSKKICWFEWSVESIGNVYDRKRWAYTNPGIGYRINVSKIEEEAESMSEDGFARERLGWWSNSSLKTVIDVDLWDSGVVRECTIPLDAAKAFGIKFSQGGNSAAVSVAMKFPSGECVYTELINVVRFDSGIAVLSDWVKRQESIAVVVIDGLAGADALEYELTHGDDKLPKRAVIKASTANMISAASMFYDALGSKRVLHFEDDTIRASAISSTKRAIGNRGGWAFGGECPEPIESFALAYWGAVTTKRNPKRKAKVL